MNGVKFGGTAARQGGCNTELSLGSALAPVSWCVRVAVRTTEEQQIFQSSFEFEGLDGRRTGPTKESVET